VNGTLSLELILHPTKQQYLAGGGFFLFFFVGGVDCIVATGVAEGEDTNVPFRNIA